MVFDSFYDASRQPKTAVTVKKRNRKHSAKKENSNDNAATSEKKKKPQSTTPAGSSTSTSSSNNINGKKRPQSSNSFPRQQHKKPRRAPPSAEALELSRQLKECSRWKQLDRALELYQSEWNKKSHSILDEHHACILIDCCARCGRVDTAVSIARPFLDDPKNANVETITSLLKAYCAHSGGCGYYMKDCLHLFEQTIQQANVRTLNTILRGCLWTAVDHHGYGGVDTAERAWRTYFQQHKMNHVSVGTSAFEYSILLLCQALRVPEAQERIQLCMEMYQLQYKGAAGFHFEETCEEEQAVMETLAVAHAALAKACALLRLSDQLWTATQRALWTIRSSRQLLQKQTNNDPQAATATTAKRDKKTRFILSGGKQGWKGHDRTQEADAARAISNQRYRLHRLDEIERDVKDIIKVRSSLPTTSQTSTLLRERLWYESETCDPIKGIDSSSTSCHHLATSSDVAAWKSFGLSQLEQGPVQTKSNNNNKNKKKGPIGTTTPPATHVAFLGNDGRLDYRKLFRNENVVELEIGAGFGSWIVHQAKQTKDRNYIAIEMKADRVAQIVSHCALEQLSNLSIVGADCLSFLRRYICHDSLSNVYANHPEPPTQTFGMNDRDRLDRIASGQVSAEPSHMLTSDAMIQIGTCLTPKTGRLTIVTDNRSYVRLLTATVACAITRMTMIQQQQQRRRRQPTADDDSSFVLPKLASIGPDRIIRDSSLSLLESSTFGNGNISVHVYEGKSGKDNGTSYFDKLWNTGAGSHAERTSRFFIVLGRM